MFVMQILSCSYGTQFALGGRSCMQISAWSIGVIFYIHTHVYSNQFIFELDTKIIHFASIAGQHDF